MDETVKMRFEWLLDDTNPDVRILLKAVHERDARLRELEALVSEARGVLSRLFDPEDVSDEEIVAVTVDARALLARMGGEHDRS